MNFKIIVALLLFLILPLTVSAIDWYVRPVQGEYGTENGTDYDNAFDGLENVVWGIGGVEPGDDLYVCGTHVFDMYDPGRNFVKQGDVDVISGTGEGARVTLRGDCPGAPGIVWGAYKNNYVNWTFVEPGIWSGRVFGNSPHDWYFQDIGGPDPDSYTLLDPVSSLAELRAHPGGAHYSAAYAGDDIYVKLTDGGDPTGRFYFAEWGYDFPMRKKHYITFMNLIFYVPGFRVGGYWDYSDMSHIIWDNCTFWYDVYLLFGNNVTHVEVRNSDIAWGIGGPGLTEYPRGNNMSPKYYVFSGNKIHDIGVRPSTQNSDAHCIGANGGWNGIIEKNEMYNCGSGITFYAYDPQSFINNTIRWNWFHDMHTLGGANDVGFEFNNGATENNCSGNKVYGNIVGPGVDGIGYKASYRDETQFFNNVCYKCSISFWVYHHLQGVREEIKNCISLYPTQRHIYSGGNEPQGDYHIDSDYNIFYPAVGNQFHFRDESGHQDIDFYTWQNISRQDCTFDPHSIVADPLFVDPDNGDFRLQAGSPAIDMGIDVGLTRDFAGNMIPQGLGPDIGVFESSFSACDVLGDVDRDCDVDLDDLIMVVNDFGRRSGFFHRADTDSSQVIDIFDIVFVASRFT